MTSFQDFGLDGLPVEGNPPSIRALARSYRTTADQVEGMAQLRSIVDQAAGSLWRGEAARAFAARLEEVPDLPERLTTALRAAADTLDRFAGEIDLLYDDAFAQLKAYGAKRDELRKLKGRISEQESARRAAAAMPDASLPEVDPQLLARAKKLKLELAVAPDVLASYGDAARSAAKRAIEMLAQAEEPLFDHRFDLLWRRYVVEFFDRNDATFEVIGDILTAAGLVLLAASFFVAPALLGAITLVSIIVAVAGAGVTGTRYIGGNVTRGEFLLDAGLAALSVGVAAGGRVLVHQTANTAVSRTGRVMRAGSKTSPYLSRSSTSTLSSDPDLWRKALRDTYRSMLFQRTPTPERFISRYRVDPALLRAARVVGHVDTALGVVPPAVKEVPEAVDHLHRYRTPTAPAP